MSTSIEMETYEGNGATQSWKNMLKREGSSNALRANDSLDMSSPSTAPRECSLIFLLSISIALLFVGALSGAGFVLLLNSQTDSVDACEEGAFAFNKASEEQLVQAGMDTKAASCLVSFRDSVGGILRDPMDMLDVDVDINEVVGGAEEWSNEDNRRRRDLSDVPDTRPSLSMAGVVESVQAVEGASSISTFSVLDGVDPSSEEFARFAEGVVESASIGGCTEQQLCLNTASARELKTLKYVGSKTATDFVSKRDQSGYCFLSTEELKNENGELDDWEPNELKGSTKGAFRRAITTLERDGETDKICAACACALCGEGEIWSAEHASCISRCEDGFVWIDDIEACVDGTSAPEIAINPGDGGEETSNGVVRFDESPKEVRFSPTPKAARRGVWQGIQDRINSATSTIDVAMFSFSDVTHRKVLVEAAKRGVVVRVIMQTSSCRSCRYCNELIEATSEENTPITVRFVTTTMHHKFTVIDYDSLDGPPPTRRCVVATGSCNWSLSSATRYDEDWIAFEGDLAPTTIRAYKQEFEWLWAYSRPCGDDPTDVSSNAVSSGWLDERIEFDGCFTSYNMEPSMSSRATWGFNYLPNGADTVGACNAKMIEAIDAASSTIDIAHTYFRSEPIFEALIRRLDDGIRVRVVNDGKEFRNSNRLPIRLAEHDPALSDVRFKYYARGWDFSCAQQMHAKFIVIDADRADEGGCIVVTGSENLSEGSEKQTFENIVISRTPFVCKKYADKFRSLLNYGINENENRTGAIVRYNAEATCFFEPITLSGNEIKTLRNSIDCRLRIGEYDGEHEDGICTFWGDRRPVLCFQNWYDEPCPQVSYEMVALGENPDLQISNFTLPTTTFTVGNSLEGSSCTVVNDGTVSSQPVKMQFIAARTANADDPTASQVSFASIPELAPGEAFTATPRFNFGAGHDLGPFEIICIADADNILLELSKENNQVARTLMLRNEYPTRNASDLVWSAAGLVETEPYGELVAGETVTFYGEVRNVGNRATTASTAVDTSTGLPKQIMMNLYISSDLYWDSGPVREGGDEQIGWVRIDPLAANASMTEISKTARINTPGTWHVLAVLDSSKVVEEKAELNNVYAHNTIIIVRSSENDNDDVDASGPEGPAPDLVVEDFQLNGMYAETGLIPYDTRVTFSSIVKNIGDLEMSNATCRQDSGRDCARMRYYFYSGPGVDVDVVGKTAEEIKNEYGMRYWYYEKIGALAANETEIHEQSRSFTRSSFETGCWSLFALLDYDDEITESDETNNFASSWIDFQLSVDTGTGPDISGALSWTKPDWVPDDAWPNGTAPLGSRISANLTLTLSNAEHLQATSFAVRFYLAQSSASVSSTCSGAGVASSEIFLTHQVVSTASFDVDGRVEMSNVYLRMPTLLEEGSYRVVAKIDTSNEIEEAYESNNIVSTDITIQNVPNAENERAGMPEYMQVMENKNNEHCPSIIKLDPLLFLGPSIGWWNLLHLSARTATERDRREWNIISCLAAHFDVLAVTELEDAAALQYLAKRACEVTTGGECDCSKTNDEGPSNCEWDWHISPTEAGRNSVCEYVGFVWNKARNASFVEPMGYYNEGANDTMKREPYGARFRIGRFDFTAVAVHQRHGGHVRYRQAEAVYSGSVFEQFRERSCGSEADVFYGGDMNLDANDRHWSLVYDESYAYLNVTWAVDPEQGTTLARTSDRTITSNAFDQIFWSSTATTEVVASGAFDFTSQEIADIHGGSTLGSNIYVTVSDHVPVYVILSNSILEGGYVDEDVDHTGSCGVVTPWPAENSAEPAAVRNREVDCPAAG